MKNDMNEGNNIWGLRPQLSKEGNERGRAKNAVRAPAQ
jgi:hypothetical protein